MFGTDPSEWSGVSVWVAGGDHGAGLAGEQQVSEVRWACQRSRFYTDTSFEQVRENVVQGGEFYERSVRSGVFGRFGGD